MSPLSLFLSPFRFSLPISLHASSLSPSLPRRHNICHKLSSCISHRHYATSASNNEPELTKSSQVKPRENVTEKTNNLEKPYNEKKVKVNDSQPLENSNSRVGTLFGPIGLKSPNYIIWGSNTDVGKTLISVGLVTSILSGSEISKIATENGSNNGIEKNDNLAEKKKRIRQVRYLKPVQTGYPKDSDARFVCQQSSLLLSTKSRPDSSESLSFLYSGPGEDDTWLSLLSPSPLSPASPSPSPSPPSSTRNLTCKNLWAWRDPVSPHLAAISDGIKGAEDQNVVESIQKFFWEEGEGEGEGRGGGEGGEGGEGEDCWGVIETAGGVHSPGPSGTLQSDLYRSLRLPGVLVGDGRLGGISATIAAYEGLKFRGLDTEAIILIDGGYSNEIAIREALRQRLPVLLLPPLPPPESRDVTLSSWFVQSEAVFLELQEILEAAHKKRVDQLGSSVKEAQNLFWWPFTQHGIVPDRDVTVIDSRSGDCFSVFSSTNEMPRINSQIDACASWWTQGPSEELQKELSISLGYAAARYGHVMFAQNVHQPALDCAKLLIQGVGKGWAQRVFFTDNGSTAIEVALKMAFRKFSAYRGFDENMKKFGGKLPELKVAALSGSYHGDTLGAMEAQAPSSYTGFLQQPWYRGRGVFLTPPTVDCRKGQWEVRMPSWGEGGEREGEEYRVQRDDLKFQNRDSIFDFDRDSSPLASIYQSFISSQLSISPPEEGRGGGGGGGEGEVFISALIIEPVIHGAGGMHLVDPLFQRILVDECRKRKIPVIFDEVLTGFWRLGVETASDLIGRKPDIGCYAKLLTGGMLPLAATLASEEIFDCFKSKDKLSALLHGHSYTAHPLGCSAAVTTLSQLQNPKINPNYVPATNRLKELWDPELVQQLSFHPKIERVISLGSIFAAELKSDAGTSGYASMAASDLLRKFRDEGIYARPLGNVIYFMCSPLTGTDRCSALLNHLIRELR